MDLCVIFGRRKVSFDYLIVDGCSVIGRQGRSVGTMPNGDDARTSPVIIRETSPMAQPLS